MPRGRLINIFYATFERQDTISTSYDDAYTEPVRARANFSPIELPCQIEEPSWFRARFKPGGLEQDGEITLILHYNDIEIAGLLDTNGNPLINIGTKLILIRRDSGAVVINYPDGLYVIQARDSSFGLSIDNDPTRNLLILLLGTRKKAV